MDFKEKIATLLKKYTNLEKDEILNLIEIPNTEMGDCAFFCFKTDKSLTQPPPMTANEIAVKIE